MSGATLSVEELCRKSDALHQRVQAFTETLALRPQAFEELALEIARFQTEAISGYSRLVEANGANLDHYDAIPAVPVEAFRLTRVAAHPESLDRVKFLTSGTTSGERGGHPMRRVDTYRKVALKWGRAALLSSNVGRVKVVCLAPPPVLAQNSSLGFMMQAFVEDFDEPSAAQEAETWLVSDAGVDVEGLRRQVDIACREQRPLLVLATSFALVYLLDALAGGTLVCPPGTVVMQTGGFKGKTREIESSELRDAVARSLGITPTQIIAEYGMTELSSQLYEGTLPGGALNSKPGWFLPPPWLRVEAISPTSLKVLAEGEEGLACFTDLANVDSAVRILTMDCVRCVDGAIQLLGRHPGAIARGCSLAVEEMVK